MPRLVGDRQSRTPIELRAYRPRLRDTGIKKGQARKKKLHGELDMSACPPIAAQRRTNRELREGRTGDVQDRRIEILPNPIITTPIRASNSAQAIRVFESSPGRTT